MFAKSKVRLVAATLALPILFLAGCGGGGNGLITNPTATPNGTATPTATATATPANVVLAKVIGLTNTNSLVRFNTQTSGTTTLIPISGLSAGEVLLGIDYRFAPAGMGTGLYGVSRVAGRNFQIYRLDISSNNTANAVRIGSGFTAENVTGVGFDFNPNVINATTGVRGDAIRLVSSTGVNFRVNADTGAIIDTSTAIAGQQNDGTLAFVSGDANQNNTPRVVGAGYTNNDTDAATGTTLYVIDAATNSLATQGRAASGSNAAVSPNTGQLFTVGSLGTSVGDENDTGFDIAPGNNTAFASFTSGTTTQLYTIDLGTGRATLVGTVGASGSTVLTDLAIVP